MFSKALKIVGLIGGGILALGTGAFGTHLAQPHLEPLLNPERKEKEDRLQESFKDAEEQVEALTRNLGELNNQGELQKNSITNLEGEVKNLNGQITTIDGELEDREKKLIDKNAEIKQQEDLNREQTTKIEGLNTELQKKQRELSDETGKKNKVKGELDEINRKLALTSDDILTKTALDQSSLKINILDIKSGGFSGGVATFNVVNYENVTKSIKVKQEGMPNYEQRAEAIKKNGINFTLDASFNNWEKTIKFQRYDVDYGYVATGNVAKDAFIKEDRTTTKEIKLADYFKTPYLEDAFKVFIAIVLLDVFPICHDLANNNNDKPYVFCENKDISVEFDKPHSRVWSEFKATEDEKKKYVAFLYSFKTIDDFINYWTKKTVDFVRTGTVDLLDFLNPIVKSQSYK